MSSTEAPKEPQPAATAESKAPVKSATPPVKESPVENGTSAKAPDPALLALPSQDKVYYYSDSDDDSDRSESDFYPPTTTNRGNKLKRGARDVRKGKLGGYPRFGSEHEEAVRKKMRIDLTPTLSLQSKRSAAEPRPRLPPLPRNPIELMTSPVILRTFAAKQSHLNTLALSAVNLVEADASLVRVLARVCDVLRGDRVPFIEDRVREVKEEHARMAAERKAKAEEKAARAAAARAPRDEPAAEAKPADAAEDAPAEDPVGQPGDIPIQSDSVMDGSDAVTGPTPVAPGDIVVGTPADGDMDVDGDGLDPSRSTSPEPDSARRRSGRRAAAKASVANLNMSQERTPSPELAEPEEEEEDLPLDQMLQPEPGAAPGYHLPPSLRRVADPGSYVRSLFVTEDAAVNVPGVSQALEPEEQYRTLHASLTELQRFLADTTEYQDRLGEIRDGALGVERRRKGLYAIIRLLASDYLSYEQMRDAQMAR